VPVGKLRNDRLIPLQDDVVALLAEWTADNAEHIRRRGRLLADEHEPIDRRTVHRIVARIGQTAGIGAVHPHHLRHTSPPRPSTEGCASKRSPPFSVTVRWR
jgi:site-specific recombinase XerD